MSAPDPFAPARLGPVQLRNRTIKSATFEGVMPHGLVTDELIDYHRKVAVGGVGMTTVAYLAVAPEGRTHAESIWLRDEALPGLRRLTDAIHAEGAAISGQIGHAGPVANGRSNGSQGIAPSRGFNPLSMQFMRRASEDDLQRIQMDFRRAGRIAAEAGFDAVEVHLGHNYLPSAFLSPRMNRRKDRWGGSIENRARFGREAVKRVREGVGDDRAVVVKLNMVDGYRGGMTIEDSLQVAEWLQEDGAADALELTGGSSFANPMYLFRGDVPLEEFRATLPQPAKFGFRFAGKRFMPHYPFEEAYFFDKAERFRERLTMPLVLLGGINRRDTIERAMAAGFDFVAMGRALLREPDLVAKMQSGEQSEGICIHCNRCMPTIYSGTRCILIDPDPIVVGTAS